MARSGSPQSTHPLRNWFDRLTKFQKVVSFSIAVIGIPGAVVGAWRVFFPPEPPLISTQIVLDISDRMQRGLEEGSRLNAAKEVIEGYVGVRPNDNIALRSFGGGCGRNELLLGFGRYEGDDIREALTGETASGEGGLAAAVIRATSDFNDLQQFPADSVRQVIVLTGGPDMCDPRAKQKIADRFEELAGTVAFKEIRIRFVGLNVRNDLKEDLEEIAEGANGELDFVDDQQELHDVVGATIVSGSPPTVSDLPRPRRPLAGVRLIGRTGKLIADRIRGIDISARSPSPGETDSPIVVAETLAAGAEIIDQFLGQIMVASPEPTLEPTE